MSDLGAKYDTGKRRASLLPTEVLRGVMDVMEFGAAKYAAHSWTSVPSGLTRYLDAMDRHRDAFEVGQDYDSESKIHHAFHFACNALFVAWFMLHAHDEVRAWRERFVPK